MHRTSVHIALAAILLVGVGCAPAVPETTPEETAPAAVEETAVEVESAQLRINTAPPTPDNRILERTIRFTPDGTYDPQFTAIHVGGTVTWINESNQAFWVASDPHPVHTNYPGFDSHKLIQPGESWSFTFDKAGDWTYHNHLQPFTQGRIDVTPKSP